MLRLSRLSLLLSLALPALAEPTQSTLQTQFRDQVHPFLKTYCLECHSGEKAKGDMDLSPFTSMQSVARDHLRWALVLDRLKAGDMPPEKAKAKPTAEQRGKTLDWINSVREYEANRNAGDPGVEVGAG